MQTLGLSDSTPRIESRWRYFSVLLLANVRGNWLLANWPIQSSAPIRLNQTVGDKISDQLPLWVWPKLRIVFYVFAAIEILLLSSALFAPRR